MRNGQWSLCVWDMYAVHVGVCENVRMHAHSCRGQWEHWVSCFPALYIIHLGQDLSLNLEVGWRQQAPLIVLTHSYSPRVCSALRFEFRSPNPHVCITKPFYSPSHFPQPLMSSFSSRNSSTEREVLLCQSVFIL